MKRYNCPDCEKDSCIVCSRITESNVNCPKCLENKENGGSGICHCVAGDKNV